MLRRHFAFALALALFLAGFAFPGAPARAADDGVIELYFIPEGIEGAVVLPEGARTSYQFPQGGDAAYTIKGIDASVDNYPVVVSHEGLATTCIPNNYSSGNPSFKSQYVDVTVEVQGKKSVTRFYVNNAYFIYCDLVMDRYLETEISGDMTETEKAAQLLKILGRDFDYGNCSTWQSMVWDGCGDCYASTGFIVEGCKRLGIKAGFHPQHWDGGASDHRNAIALCDGDLWVLDVSTGTKPRSTWSRKLDCDYQWSFTDATHEKVCLWRYERMLVEPERGEVVVVPETLEGGVVTEIGYPYFDISFAGFNTTTILLPSRLETIHPYAFCYHEKLTGLTLPGTVTSIGAYAFYNCGKLGSLALPRGVTELKSATFAFCGALTLTVPASVTAIAGDCFYGTEVTLVVEHGSYAEVYARDNDLKCQYTGETVLPADLKHIESGAFEGAGLTAVVVPDGALSIGEGAFADCPGLRWIHIPASVTDIRDTAFAGIAGLTIEAPAGSAAAQFAQRKGFTLVEP